MSLAFVSDEQVDDESVDDESEDDESYSLCPDYTRKLSKGSTYSIFALDSRQTPFNLLY